MGTHLLDNVGLDVAKDRILEIACIITDGKLTKQIEVAVEFKYLRSLFYIYSGYCNSYNTMVFFSSHPLF
mgnify:CR=1 FL=1|jgi:uncharacterized protein YjhX (UPF0386 family)